MSSAAPVVVARAERRADRLVGIDAARGLALLGMFAAHLTNVHQLLDWGAPDTWWVVVAGRSSVLFAVLAGVSLALVTGRDRPVRGHALTVARRRITARGVLIALVGFGLIQLQTPVAVILPTYGILFLILLPTLSWRRPALLGTAGALAVFALPIALASLPKLSGAGTATQQVLLYYPLATFAVYLLVGLAVGRSDLTSPRTLGRLAGGGAALALVVYAAGEAVTPGGAFYEGAGSLTPIDFVFASEPHSSTLVDILGSVGVALAVIGVCGLLAQWSGSTPGWTWTSTSTSTSNSNAATGPVAGAAPARGRSWARIPLGLLAGVGAIPLTVYSVHLVVIAVLYHSGFLAGVRPGRDAIVFVCFVAGSCALGFLLRGRPGPLERVISGVARRVGGRARA